MSKIAGMFMMICLSTHVYSETVRFATFNVSFDRAESGELALQMSQGGHPQITNIAEIIQRVNADVILLNEYDHDGIAEDTQSVEDFISLYLNIGQNGAKGIDYPYYYIAPTNTGRVVNDIDLNGDGEHSQTDALGFGAYHGQYGFIVLSKYPIDKDSIRTFQELRWWSVPDAELPLNADGSDYLSQGQLEQFRLSSKNHVDLPINIGTHTVHFLAMHPTPPVFDGPEDLNGRRNHDEIKLFADYIAGADYLLDDSGRRGGLSSTDQFVIAGDLNADPSAGDSYNHAIAQLLDNPLVNSDVARGDLVPTSSGSTEYSQGRRDDLTSTFGLRVDYVLPSANLSAVASGVSWEESGSEQRYLYEDKDGNQGKAVSSDHRLVWVDIQF